MNDDPALIQQSKDIVTDSLASVSGGAAENDWLVIAHDIHYQTAYNLTEFMLRTMLAQGYRPVTLGECLDDPKKNWYRS
jgi:chitin deacetylase